MVRTTLIGGSLEGGALLSFTVAFIGASGAGTMRAVSLRGLIGLTGVA